MSEAPVTPLAAPLDAARLILFGGTFDPPHRAHVELPLAARDLIEARDAAEGRPSAGAWLVFVPAARSPHKSEGPEAPDEDRVAMLRIAIGEAGVSEGAHDRIAIWTDEIDRARWAAGAGTEMGPSYMVDTLRRVSRALGHNGASIHAHPSLTLLIGADQALAFHRWAEHREILRLADVLVMPRDGVATGDDLVERLRASGAWSAEDLERWRSSVLELPLCDVAATPVRSWLRDQHAQPAHEAELASALGAGVLRYIQRHGLYSARP